MTLGGKIREVRRANRQSQEEFATQLGISRSVLSQIEIDRIKPSVETIKKISTVFNVSLDYLIRADEISVAEKSPQREIFYSVQEPLFEMASSLASKNYSVQRESFAGYRSHSSGLREIPYLRLMDRKRFAGVSTLLKHAPNLDLIRLPVSTTGILMAFETTSDHRQQPDLLVCELSEPELIHDDMQVVLVTAEKIINGRVVRADGKSLHFDDKRIPLAEVTECWKGVIIVTSALHDNSLSRRIANLERMMEGMKKKKS